MLRENVTRGVVVLAVIAGGFAARAAVIHARPAAVAVDPEVLEVREAAWRAWFAGDERTLGDLLPSEFLAIGAEGGPDISDRAKTLESSRKFKASGGRLITLTFAETRSQRYGDTVILYGFYEAVFETGAEKHTMRGRLTEIFVRRDGRWIHPGWHLDAQP
jgi:hypothetical protein